MERLTKRNEDGSVSSAIDCPNGCKYFTCSMEEGQHCSHECEADYMCKLAKYEDLEEQGLLLKLPCKVGDTVYSIHSLPSSGKKIISEDIADAFYLSLSMFEKRFGDTVFLTIEEAEQKLKELAI